MQDIHKALEELGISIQAEFVPKLYYTVKDAKLNWYVTLAVDGKPILSTDYSAGIGHIEGYEMEAFGRMTVEAANAILGVCNGIDSRKIKRPNLDPADVVYCLVNDASAIDHPDFESWASDYGFDTDSRKAEKIYQACLDIGLKMRATLADEKLNTLHELFQDY